ncbi:3-hydroxyacyl-CoA dehydrogenase family protein [Nonomuraea sp. NPDC049695]|uniref:3-hydroxyacyl-CoA dehydrogenase family protein n=1 Tax=Nonomuraea sp. NPDC049695 TaxID=3154734 RepID=UPI0034452A28
MLPHRPPGVHIRTLTASCQAIMATSGKRISVLTRVRRPAKNPGMTLIGVVGAGVMGVGVAQNLAEVGHQVILVDQKDDILNEALRRLAQNCRLAPMLRGEQVDVSAVMSAVKTSTALEDLGGTATVIENVTEDIAIKRDVYQRLDAICPEGTIFIANTSAIPITTLAAATGRPGNVVGAHFMNPVPMKTAVELIPGVHTSEKTLERARALLAEMGKRAIEVTDSCGFLSNRVLMLTINEAAFLVYEGVASASAVDDVFRSCFGHPMGPLETADLIGIDTILHSVRVLHSYFADSKYRPCPLLIQMTDAGLLGRKSGQGFHSYR